VTSKEAAGRAVSILNDADQTDPGFLVYLLQPSNVLLLAGLRAQSPYNSFSPRMTPIRLQRLESLLARHGIRLVPEGDLYEPDGDISYSLLCPELLQRLPERYQALSGQWRPISNCSAAGFAEWCYATERHLATLMSRGVLPKEWLRDWWAPHHLRFGMLLGYPGVAISSNLWSDAWHETNGREEPFDAVKIGTDQSCCASVGFYCAHHAVNSAEVRQLRGLWEQTLAIVDNTFSQAHLTLRPAYRSEHATLSADKTKNATCR